MLFRNPPKRQTSLSLNINGRQIEEAKTINFVRITMTPHIKWNENCKDIATRANKQIFQLWRLSKLNVEQEIYFRCTSPGSVLYFYMQTLAG